MLTIEIEEEHKTSFTIWGIGWKLILDCMESNSQSRRKGHVVDKLSNYYPFIFLHLEIEKPAPYVGDICVTTLLWGKCEDETHTLEIGTWESFGTPKTLEFDCRGQNSLHWGVFYIIGKLLKCRCRKWPCMGHGPFGHLQHKLGQKEGPGVKLAVWFPITKSRESTRPWCVQVECDTLLESSWGKLQLCFRPHPNRRSKQRVMIVQSPKSRNQDSFGTPPWESRDKKPFGCGCHGEAQSILYGGSGGFPWVRAVVSHVNPELPMACLSTKGVPESELTNLLVGFDAGSSKWKACHSS